MKYLYFQEFDSPYPKAGLWPDKVKEISFIHKKEDGQSSAVCGEKEYNTEIDQNSVFGSLTSIVAQDFDDKTLINFSGIQSCSYNKLIWLGFSSGAIIPFDPTYSETLSDFTNYSAFLGNTGDISEIIPIEDRLIFVDRGLQYIGITSADGKTYRIIR